MKFTSTVLCLALSATLLLSACNRGDDQIFVDLENHFQNSSEPTTLDKLTAFDWDEFCIFMQADSFPYSAYDSYNEYLTEKNIEGTLSKGRYRYVLIFSKNGQISKEYSLSRSLSLKNKAPSLELDDEHDGHGMMCGGREKGTIDIVKEYDIYTLFIR